MRSRKLTKNDIKVVNLVDEVLRNKSTSAIRRLSNGVMFKPTNGTVLKLTP